MSLEESCLALRRQMADALDYFRDATGRLRAELLHEGCQGRTVTVERIVAVVCEMEQISFSHMASRRRSQSVVKARQVAMYLACTLTETPLAEIGLRLGGRDHSTVIHGRDAVAEQLAAGDVDVKRLVEAAADALGCES
jgi:chromosomal replication initiation ATPase DnaA